jgi:hypothetical protein
MLVVAAVEQYKLHLSKLKEIDTHNHPKLIFTAEAYRAKIHHLLRESGMNVLEVRKRLSEDVRL